MAYNHGITIEEVATSLVTATTAEAAMPVIIGTAPVHNLAEDVAKPINKPCLIYSMTDFVTQFGEPSDDESKADFTLYQAAEIYLSRYKCAPIVAINVFDPDVHVDDDGNPDVGKVASADIIGKTSTTGRTGLALVEEVFPRFRLVPGQILAPKFSADPTVAIALGTACVNISGYFRATGIFDVPDTITHYSDVPAWLNTNNLINENLFCMYGNGLYDDVEEPGSIHLAGAIGQRDAENSDIPYWSPSNQSLLVEGMTHAGSELFLSPSEAAYLNSQGIVTGLNMIGGLVAWGDQTTAYPSNSDVKDASIPVRRMFSWLSNMLVLTAWQYVSAPLRRRMIETVQDVFTLFLNGLVAREFILGGRVTFEDADNPTLDLMDGIVRFHVYFTPPSAAREIVFTLEYDPDYLSTLYS